MNASLPKGNLPIPALILEQFPFLWESSTLSALLLTETGAVTDINPALRHLLKRPERFRPGMSLRMWWGETYASNIMEHLSSESQLAKASSVSVRIPDAEDEIDWIEFIPLENHWLLRGKPKELGEDRAKVLEYESVLKELGRAISHDMRAPIRHMIQFCQYLKDKDKFADSGLHAMIAPILDSSQELFLRFEALAAFTRKELEELNLAPTDLEQVIDMVLGSFQLELDSRSAVLERDPLPVIRGDFAALINIFEQFLANALRHVPPTRAPHLRVSLEQEVKGLRISLSDNGIGFEPARASKLYELFSLVHERQEFPVQGAGMGLAIASRLANRMGMDLSASGVLGEGAVFSVHIPTALVLEMPEKMSS